MQAILQNILDEISWEDDYVQEKILPILGKLMQKEEFIPEILSQSVRGLKIPDSFSEIDITECGKFYKNLEFLTLNTKLAKINVGDFKKLKKLSVMDQQAKAIEGLDQLFELEELNLEKATSLQGDFYLGELGKLRTFLLQSANIRYVGLWQLPEITELNLNNMSSLREMDMDDMEKLTKLSCEKSGIQSVNFLSNMPHLKNISFRNSEIAKIDGLEKLSQLENLNFEDTPNLTNISLKGLFSLKTLSFGNSAIAIINDLEELSQLEDLNLRNTKKLTNISLKGLSNLKKFSCFYSKLENIEDISGFSNLEYISVENTKNLNELSLKDLPNLKFLILNGSNIKTLSLENIDLLSNLDLSNLVLKSLVFRGALKNMDKVFLRNAYELESLTGLDNLTNLGILELTDTEKLLSLEFKKDNKMLKLYLRGSLISKDTIKGLEHLDEKNISTSY